MAHLFKQIYVDEVDFEETLILDRLINLIFKVFVHRQIPQLEELESSVRWAISMIDRWDIWRGILETSKVLKYHEPLVRYRRYFYSLFSLSWIMWSKMYSETEWTMSINNLMD